MSDDRNPTWPGFVLVALVVIVVMFLEGICAGSRERQYRPIEPVYPCGWVEQLPSGVSIVHGPADITGPDGSTITLHPGDRITLAPAAEGKPK